MLRRIFGPSRNEVNIDLLNIIRLLPGLCVKFSSNNNKQNETGEKMVNQSYYRPGVAQKVPGS